MNTDTNYDLWGYRKVLWSWRGGEDFRDEAADDWPEIRVPKVVVNVMLL